MKKEFITDYGKIEVRNAMFEEENGTDLYEGIQIKDKYGAILEIRGWRDVDELTVDDVEKLYEKDCYKRKVKKTNVYVVVKVEVETEENVTQEELDEKVEELICEMDYDFIYDDNGIRVSGTEVIGTTDNKNAYMVTM